MGRIANCECGGFTLAYLVTGSSGIFRAHFTLSLVVDSATLRNVQTGVNKKRKRVRPRNKVNDMTAHGTAPRTMQTNAKITKSGYSVNNRVRSFCGQGILQSLFAHPLLAGSKPTCEEAVRVEVWGLQ